MKGYEMVDPATLDVAPPFSDLFPITPSVREAIEASMRLKGYDGSKPINVWRDRNLVVDGNTRRLCAIATGLHVAVFYHDFADEDEALEYAVANQRDRRNLTDADILRCTAVLDKRKPHGGECNERSNQHLRAIASSDAIAKPINRSSARTAEVVGTSATKIERARTVLDHADEETKQEVLEGKTSINMAYNKTQARRKNKAKQPIQTRIVTPPANGVGRITLEAREPEPRTPDDEAWLASLPLRDVVIRKNRDAHRFEEDALLYRRVEGLLAQLKEEVMAVVGDRSTRVMSPFQKAVFQAANAAPVNQWTLCPACNGTGSDDRGICRKCGGGSHRVPGISA